jgi:cytochrome c5
MRFAAGLLSAASVAAGCGETVSTPEPACEPDDTECADKDSDTLDTKTDDKPKVDAGSKPAPTKTDASAPATAKPPTATTTNGPKVATPSNSDLPCDVQTILTKYCSTCHGEKPVSAPMSLVTSAHFQAPSKTGMDKTFERVKARVNEKGAKSMPPPGYTELRAHNGDGKTPFDVGLQSDSYFNFTFEAPWKETLYAVKIETVVDNAEVLHHWLLFQDELAMLPSGAVPQIGAHPSGQLLYGWAPGGDDFDFREAEDDVSIEMPANTTYTVEYHYNSSDPFAKDSSGVRVCGHKRKTKEIAALSWLGNDNLTFPSDHWEGTCTPLSAEPIKIIGLIPHMHKTGNRMKGTINRAGGKQEVLHDQKFSFDFQKSYKVKQTLMPGDTITTECWFNQPMLWGESTEAEMCYLFTMAYPKGALQSVDVWGRIAHGGSSCLGQ